MGKLLSFKEIARQTVLFHDRARRTATATVIVSTTASTASSDSVAVRERESMAPRTKKTGEERQRQGEIKEKLKKDKEEKKKKKNSNKGKANVAVVGLSFDDEDLDEGDDYEKKRKKSFGALGVIEEVDDDDDDDLLTAELNNNNNNNEKKKKKKSSSSEFNTTQYDKESLKKELEEQRLFAMNRPKEHAQEKLAMSTATNPFPHSGEEEDDGEQEAMDVDNDNDNDAFLPTDKTILEAKMKRRAKQGTNAGKNFIPLVDGEEEEDGNEKKKKKKGDFAFNSIAEEQPRMVMNKNINKSVEERANLALAKLQNASQNAKRKLDACLENVERSNQASVRSSESLKNYERILDESKLRYALAQELGVFFRAVSGMLSEKLPLIEELEAQMLETVKSRGRKRRETREKFKAEVGAEAEIAFSGKLNSSSSSSSDSSNIKELENVLLSAVIRSTACDVAKIDELGRDMNLARKQSIERRAKLRFEALIIKKEYKKEVYSQFNVNDDEGEETTTTTSTEVKKKFLDRVESISDIAKNVIFKDVSEEFSSVNNILEKLTEWKTRDRKSYDEYAIFLADVFELFARVDLLKAKWISKIFSSSLSESSDVVVADFPWNNYNYDGNDESTTNLMIEVYSRTIASLCAKCCDDEDVWDVFEKDCAKSIQNVREEMNKTLQNAINRKTGADDGIKQKSSVDVAHLEELVNEVTLGIQRRMDDALLRGEYYWWKNDWVQIKTPEAKAIADAFKSWKEEEEPSLELVALTLEIE
jgi:hypothetical protein